MDRSAHVWGKYKALLTVISGYNWWVVFYCISFSWLTAFLKSPLNGKLIGWLNLHFNQSIYDRGSPRNSLAEDEATFPEGLERGSGLCSVSTHLLLLLSFVQKGLCVGGTGTPVASLSPATLGLISCRKGQMPGQGNPSHACVSPVTGCQIPAPWAAAVAPKLPHQGLPVGGSDIFGGGKGNSLAEPAFSISQLGWKPTEPAPRRPCQRPQPWVQRCIYSRP